MSNWLNLYTLCTNTLDKSLLDNQRVVRSIKTIQQMIATLVLSTKTYYSDAIYKKCSEILGNCYTVGYNTDNIPLYQMSYDNADYSYIFNNIFTPEMSREIIKKYNNNMKKDYKICLQHKYSLDFENKLNEYNNGNDFMRYVICTLVSDELNPQNFLPQTNYNKHYIFLMLLKHYENDVSKVTCIIDEICNGLYLSINKDTKYRAELLEQCHNMMANQHYVKTNNNNQLDVQNAQKQLNNQTNNQLKIKSLSTTEIENKILNTQCQKTQNAQKQLSNLIKPCSKGFETDFI